MMTWLTKFFDFILSIGFSFLISGVKTLSGRWKKDFKNYNFLILGPKETGKTSLMWLMQKGRPYIENNGDKELPSPTVLAVIDVKFKIKKKSWMKLNRDIGGEIALKDQWKIAINEIKPHGIIYIIDGRRVKQLKNFTDRLFEDVLTYYTGDKGLRIYVLHIFINFMDIWAISDEKKRKTEFKVRERVELLRNQHPGIVDFRFHVSSIQLSPMEKSWAEAERALAFFGSDLDL